MRAMLLAGTALAALSTAVWAQSASSPNNQNASDSSMKSQLMQMLQKSGYTDVRVAPSSFMVRAKDADGNRIVMSISPDSFAEVANINTTGNANSTSSGSGSSTSSTYVAIPSSDELSSKIVGLEIYNNSNNEVGTIKDIALNQNGRAAAYIVSVGGFLGVGEHYVAINPSAVKIAYNDADRKWHATMNATTQQVLAAPEFKYAGRWASNRT